MCKLSYHLWRKEQVEGMFAPVLVSSCEHRQEKQVMWMLVMMILATNEAKQGSSEGE